MYSVQIIPQNLKMVEFLANAAELTDQKLSQFFLRGGYCKR